MTYSGALIAVLNLVLAAYLPATEAATLLDPLPENSTTLFGATLVAIGDVNGDGVADLAVGAPFQDGDFVSTDMTYGPPQNVGKVFVLSGVTLAVLSILNDPEFELIQPLHFGGQLGASLGAVADLNGDGVADIVVGVPHHIEFPSEVNQKLNAGKALVFSGKDGTLLFSLNDPTAEEDGKMGTAVAGLGDVDGDGVPDLLVGVPGKDIGGEEGVANVGLAYIFSGATGQVIRTLNHPTAGGAEAGAAFGSAVANAGDVDHDGVSDILIGSPGDGHVFVFSGKAPSALLFTITSPSKETLPSFGSAVAGGKDFDQDGMPDFVIGAPLQNGLSGAAYVFNGRNGTLQRRLQARPTQRFAKFGAAVFAADDLTGDGRPDVIVGASAQNVNGLSHAGAAYIFDGARGKLFKTLTSKTPQAYARFGAALGAADFDANGIGSAVVGVPDQDASLDSVPHLQIGQIEVQQ